MTPHHSTCSLLVLLLPLMLLLSTTTTTTNARPLNTLTRSAVAPALSQYFSNFKRVYALQEPAGVYKGSKTVLGETVNIETDFNNPNEMNLAFSGPISISCNDEPYTLNGETIALSNMDKSGDCVHDTLQQNQVTLQGISYDASSDTIEIKAKYLFLDLSFDLEHEQTLMVRGDKPKAAQPSSQVVVASPHDQVKDETQIAADDMNETHSTEEDSEYEREDHSLMTQVQEMFDKFHEQAGNKWEQLNDWISDAVHVIKPKPKPDPSNHTRPCGTYKGKKKILGHKMKLTISIKDNKTLDIESDGIFEFACKKEKYSFENRTLNFTKLDKDGDCMHDALNNNSLVLQTIVYHNCSDKLYVFMRHSVIPIMVVLKHKDDLTSNLPADNNNNSSNNNDVNSDENEDSNNNHDNSNDGVEVMAHHDHSKHPVIATVKKLAMDVIGKGASTFHSLKHAVDSDSKKPSSTDHSADAVGVAERMFHAMKRTPTGSYHGVKTVLGKRFDIRVQVNPDSPNLVSVSSPSGELQPLLQCANESIRFGANRNGAVMVEMEGVSKGGNCVHDALVESGMVFESFVYDQVSDELVLVTRIAGVRIKVAMPHEN